MCSNHPIGIQPTKNSAFQNTDIQFSGSLKRIWEIRNNLQCPVIGTCLSIEEHKRILRKAGYNPKNRKPYEIHGILMGQLEENTRIAIKTENYLRSKFRQAFEKYEKIEISQLLTYWISSLISGDFAGILLVMTLRSDMPDDLLDQISGEIHVLGHVNISMVQKNKNEVQQSQKQIQDLKAALKLEQKLLREKTKDHRKLEDQNSKLVKELAQLKKDYSELKSSRVDSIEVQTKVEQLIKESEIINEFNRDLKSENTNQKNQIFHLENKIQILKSKHQSLAENQNYSCDISEVAEKAITGEACENGKIQCSNFDLCRKKVLVVGGMTKFKHLYKEAIEGTGGQFEYHDGYIKNGIQNLENQVGRSDLILCPVNCNSHGAAGQVKKMGLKYNKPVKMLRSSSVNAITAALSNNNTSIGEWVPSV